MVNKHRTKKIRLTELTSYYKRSLSWQVEEKYVPIYLLDCGFLILLKKISIRKQRKN